MQKTEDPKIVDLSQVSLADLFKPDGDTVLDHTIRRALDKKPDDAVSAFNSAT